jgi:hypothetical protein
MSLIQYLKPQMKRPYLLLCLLLLISSATFAQKDVIKIRSCDDSFIQHEVDSLKAMYSKDGFMLLKEASVAMESEYELPVIVPLSQGSWYQFVFIGDYTSKLYEVRMYDWNEKMVVYEKKQWGEVDGNIISYAYMPQFSEYHMMKPVQVNKKKKSNLCGYVMLFKKTAPGAPGNNANNTGR